MAIFKQSPDWEARSAWQSRAAERAELSPTAMLQGAHTSSRGQTLLSPVPSTPWEPDSAIPSLLGSSSRSVTGWSAPQFSFSHPTCCDSHQVPCLGLCVSQCLWLEGVGCLECWGFSKLDLTAAATTGHFIE